MLDTTVPTRPALSSPDPVSADNAALDERRSGTQTLRPLMEWHRAPYFVSDERARLDLGVIHAYLARSYWARAIPRERVARSREHSLAFGLFRASPETPQALQIGFARVISDRTTFAYLCDVFVLEEERGRGLGAFLIECVHAHPELQDLRRWLLVTRDAHALYAPFGWRVTPEPETHMEIVKRDPYLAP